MISQLSLWGLHWELTSIWSHEGGFAGSSVVRNPPANAEAREDTGSIPGLGRSPGEGNGNPLQYSCLENPMKRGAWWATVHGVVKSWRRLSDWAHMHASSWKLVAFTYFYQLGIWSWSHWSSKGWHFVGNVENTAVNWLVNLSSYETVYLLKSTSFPLRPIVGQREAIISSLCMLSC